LWYNGIAMSNLAPEWIYRRNLPHIRPPGATFFVTFRLAGSIPADVLTMLHAEAKQILSELERMPDSPERAERLYL
jgi:putative transposase